MIQTVGCTDTNADLGIAFEGFRSVNLILILLTVYLEKEETNYHPALPKTLYTMRQWIKPATPTSVKHIQNPFTHNEVSSSEPPKEYNYFFEQQD